LASALPFDQLRAVSKPLAPLDKHQRMFSLCSLRREAYHIALSRTPSGAFAWAADGIRAHSLGSGHYGETLLSGLPPEERERRSLMVIQTGYFDDSGSDALSQYYVLAGFIASVEQWEKVSTKWRHVLDKEPNLRYFKMKEAMNMVRQFERGWTVPLRNQRILSLSRLLRNWTQFVSNASLSAHTSIYS